MGAEIPLTLAYKLNNVCNAGHQPAVQNSVCIPYGKRTKINYKVSVTLYLVYVKWYNSIYRYFGRASYNVWFM